VEDLSEKEQLDAMRAWWSENGNYVIGGIVVGIIIIFGLNQYRSTVAEAEIAASTLYEEVMFAALFKAIREGKTINDGKLVAEATMTGIMGRTSAYTGRELKWDYCVLTPSTVGETNKQPGHRFQQETGDP